MVISDLNHLLADIVLGADAALGAGPPGQRITGLEQVLVSGAWRDRLLPLTCCSWCPAKVAGSPGQNQEVTQTRARQPVHPTSWGSQAERTSPSSSSGTQSQAFQIPGVRVLTSDTREKGTAASRGLQRPGIHAGKKQGGRPPQACLLTDVLRLKPA